MIHALAAVFQGRPASTLAQKSTKARTLAARRVRETWQAHFHAQGQRHPLARMRMLDGFNEGWLEFEGVRAEPRTGGTSLETVLAGLLAKTPA